MAVVDRLDDAERHPRSPVEDHSGRAAFFECAFAGPRIAGDTAVHMTAPVVQAIFFSRRHQPNHVSITLCGASAATVIGHTADPTLGDLVLVLRFLFVLLAVSALAPPARNHSAFVSFFFVADLLVFGWLFFFADFFVIIGYLLGRLGGNLGRPRP